MYEPIGLVGLANAGSSRSTSVCVTTHDRLAPDAAAPERVAQRLEEHVADRALRVGARRSPSAPAAPRRWRCSERRRMKPTCGPLPCVTTTFQPASIMSAMSLGELAHLVVLVEDRLVLAIADQRVAADRDDGESVASSLPLSARSASAATAWVKHASGARVMPAPIWPTPASVCAMPVLMTGSMPRVDHAPRVDARRRAARNRAPAA